MPAMEQPAKVLERATFSGGVQSLRPAGRAFAIMTMASLLVGCQRLPDCVQTATGPNGVRPLGAVGRPKPKPAQELLIGIDGSGSMLGYTRTANPAQWETMLQAIKSAATESGGLSVKTFRIGAGNAQELPNSSALAAKDPCFFQGCGSYASMPSSLQALWQVQGKAKAMPLRLLVSDLEVNGDDISSLIGAIQGDTKRGASVGVLALRLPFKGDVFNARAETIFSGNVNRPVYMLATGELSQVASLLNSIREKMSLSGVSAQKLSLINAQHSPKTLLATHVDFEPQGSPPSYSPGSLKLQGRQYNQGKNQDYVFALLAPGTTSVQMKSVNPWPGGTEPREFMVTRLERIPLNQGESEDPGDIRISSLSLAGAQVRMSLTIPRDVQPGAIRITIPAGSLPEPWWITWNRDSPNGADAKEKTDGLLRLLIALSQQVRAAPNAPPAASFCLVFDFVRTKTTP